MGVEELLVQIRSGQKGREKVIEMLYGDEKLRNGIKKIVKVNVNQDAHFNEIFNYSLVQFLKTVIENPKFVIQENIYSYLFGVARNLHYMKLRKERKANFIAVENMPEIPKDKNTGIDLQIMEEDKKVLLQKILTVLGDKCRNIINLWSQGYRMKEIVKLENLPSEASARKKKFDCMKKLSTYLDANPSISKLLKE